MHGRARIVWNHCAGFDSGILLCSVDTKQASPAIARYMQSFEDTDGDGIANVPEYYETTHGRKVVVREWSELGILGAIIVLRAMLTFLIHWEIKNEKRETQEEQGGKLE